MKNNYIQTLPYLNPERTQQFIGLGLTLIALSFFGFFAINPTISTILRLQKEVADSEFVYNQLDTKIKNLSNLRGEYSNIQNDLPTIINAIPTEPDATLLFAQIQSIAQQSDLEINKLQNFEVEVLKNDKGTSKKYYSYSFVISGSGTFSNISNFASTLTSMQRIVSIDILTINNTLTQDNQSLGFNIQGTAFFKE